MAPKRSSPIIAVRNKKRKSSRKKTWAEINANLDLRARELQDRDLQLEQLQVVTQETMRLEFRPILSNKGLTNTDQ